ncbi:dicarboxylate/amino acid:cation symporter [Sphingomonas spermidinifaciens]|uniref:Dicarboxylate/amino acid:cation symporter n=1 Tax=Sphingomonas spermidinifaciens TaxID=1141889 RepID=A0A2A4B3Q4_9SPHN|nr:dicarboxylate/amino acid:cation symporter [Sphingomonas spermidinifaciens]PCD02276.1 dicarboxylate/amino acid:cation symporter [Sphingomonas spermidinifaciens]
MITRWLAVPLWLRVLGGLVLGVLLGLAWPEAAPRVVLLGEWFVRAIRMLVAPIVLVTIAAGIASMADPAKLGRLGLRTIGLFAATTLAAVAIGMAVAALVQPGAGAPLAGVAAQALGEPRSLYDTAAAIVPLNIVEALAKGDMLALIFTAILIGAGTVAAGEAGRPFARGLEALSAVLLSVVRLVMEATPFGVFALIANAVAASGLELFGRIGWLALAVVIGSIAQMAIVHAPLLLAVARRSPLGFWRDSVEALAIGFSTASSAAVLPVAIRLAEMRHRIAAPVAQTVLPLGASIGKDGTAMYVGLLSVFSLQALGHAIAPADWAVILVTGALAAFGTAPVPSASLFMLAAVLAAVGVSAAETALIVGLVLPFDRLLDMTRTVPSASANLTVAACVDRLERRA